jgi:hypothetical protein
VDGGENSWQLRLFRSVFFQKFSCRNISQTKTDIEDRYSENVQDMEEKNISKYCSDPTMEGGVIAVGVSAINMSSL